MNRYVNYLFIDVLSIWYVLDDYPSYSKFRCRVKNSWFIQQYVICYGNLLSLYFPTYAFVPIYILTIFYGLCYNCSITYAHSHVGNTICNFYNHMSIIFVLFEIIYKIYYNILNLWSYNFCLRYKSFIIRYSECCVFVNWKTHLFAVICPFLSNFYLWGWWSYYFWIIFCSITIRILYTI